MVRFMLAWFSSPYFCTVYNLPGTSQRMHIMHLCEEKTRELTESYIPFCLRSVTSSKHSYPFYNGTTTQILKVYTQNNFWTATHKVHVPVVRFHIILCTYSQPIPDQDQPMWSRTQSPLLREVRHTWTVQPWQHVSVEMCWHFKTNL